jgi:hypothetical protein
LPVWLRDCVIFSLAIFLLILGGDSGRSSVRPIPTRQPLYVCLPQPRAQCPSNLPSTMSNSTSATSGNLGIQSITFENSLIPVGALTTLIGSDIAETLALGERGSAGLVWSVTSAFGAPSVIKACINGAGPGWLRSLLGMRSIASDRAIGLKLALKSSWAIRVRRTFNNAPLGVSCDAKALQVDFLSILWSRQWIILFIEGTLVEGPPLM